MAARAALRRRGNPVGRDDRLAAAADALGNRAGGPPAVAPDRRRRRPARRGGEPARPPALARDLQRRARGRPPVPRPACVPDPSVLAVAARARRPGHPADPFHGPDVRAVDRRAGERLHPARRDGPATQPRRSRLTGPTPEDPLALDPNILACEPTSTASSPPSTSAAGSGQPTLARVGRRRAVPRPVARHAGGHCVPTCARPRSRTTTRSARAR